ncbi:multidrug and toxin extrusion protein 1-like [Tubulanus polymorphus]|uniref:multidrug and toxin extrusion protein 1-like n=1 Tax=Tubulanus polymorphus TaxID=672921 RepID=UPI003DA45015
MLLVPRNRAYTRIISRMNTGYSFILSSLISASLLSNMATSSTSGAENISKKLKNVIVFGGNGFIGGATVRQLIASSKYDVTIVNRGSWNWDSRDNIKPHVRHINCDRYGEGSIGYVCPELVKLVDSIDSIHAVVDFSAYESRVIVDAVKLLTRKPVGVYIYISSDSVYEVCNKTHENPSIETDAVRPENAAERERLNLFDSYGHRKLEGEEVLLKMRANDGPAYVFLRLPDVIGPRDSTDRWWIYQLWIKLSAYTREPVRLPRSVSGEPLSFVYVNDVARCIAGIVSTRDKTVYNEAYNLAFDETVSLEQLLEMIRDNLVETQTKFIYDEDVEKEFYLYPSVTKGPIDIAKARRKLNWKPTSLEDAVRQTVQFYEKAMKNANFKREIKEIVRNLRKDVFHSNTLLSAGLDELYGYNLHAEKQKHDELCFKRLKETMGSDYRDEEETILDGKTDNHTNTANTGIDYGAIKLEGDEFVVTDYNEENSSCKCCRFLPHWYKEEAKALTKLALPMVFTSLFNFLMGPISLIFCGMLSTDELGGAALANTVINVFGIAPASGMATAADTLFSQTYGSSNKKKVGIYLQRALLLVSLLILPCWAVHLNIGSIFVLIGQDPKVSAIAADYVVYFMPGLFFNYIYQVLQKYLYNQNVVIPTIIFGVIGTIVNVVSHVILLIVYDYGTNGSAVCQAMAFFSMLVCILVYIVWSGIYEETWSGFSMEAFQCWGEFCRIAIPGLLMIFIEWGSFEVGTILTGVISVVQLDAQSILFQVATLTWMIPLGFSISTSIRIGQFLGKGDALSAKRAGRTAVSIVCITATIMSIVVISLRNELPKIFTDDSEVIDYSANVLMPVVASYLILDSIQGVCAGILRGCGRQQIGAVFIFITYCVIALPTGIPLMFLTDLQSQGIWIGLNIGLFVETCSFAILIIRTDWDYFVIKAQEIAGTKEVSNSALKRENPRPDETTGLLTEGNDAGIYNPNYEQKFERKISRGFTRKQSVVINYSENRLTTQELICRRGLLLIILLVVLAIGVYLHIVFPVECVQPFSNGTYPDSIFPHCLS